ncbi:hypothetical protein [Patulibacter defluvii]|uniref:hypothetical protein n=1 Tax=Patulibacter defluvii TaxID=3095358 RepID=UPI002A74DFD4|nr:hypothetical protein [Patulibacter sp. DM4]
MAAGKRVVLRVVGRRGRRLRVATPGDAGKLRVTVAARDRRGRSGPTGSARG